MNSFDLQKEPKMHKFQVENVCKSALLQKHSLIRERSTRFGIAFVERLENRISMSIKPFV